jgi:N-acetylmuramic acid 6-phosphate etherase
MMMVMEDIRNIITEQRNQCSYHIDRKSTEEIVKIINKEDQTVTDQIEKEINSIVKVIDTIVDSMQLGGRLFYVGAGTSGRIGTLDASECPPTYGTPPDLVQAIIAGGDQAVFQAVEGAEDDEELGAYELGMRNVQENDVVIGITASGRAPYVIGALKEAKNRGAVTVSFTCNKDAVLNHYADLLINIEVGPEVVMGSTRMKAGTSQKLVLNMITTTTMIKLGKVYDNLMVDLQPLNKKLINRSKRIIQYAVGCTEEVSAKLFEDSGRSPKVAIVMYRCQVDRDTAIQLLKSQDGVVHQAIASYTDLNVKKGG